MFNRLHFFMNNLCKNTGGSKDQDLMEARRNYADIDLISAIYSSDDIDLKSPILEPVSDKGALLQTFKIARYSAISPPHHSLYPPFPISSSSTLSLPICPRPACTMGSRARAFGSNATNSLWEILLAA